MCYLNLSDPLLQECHASKVVVMPKNEILKERLCHKGVKYDVL